jgi:cytochrome c5
VSEAQDETFSPQNITVLGGLLLIAIILGEVVIGHHGNDEMATESVDTMEDVAMRLQPVVTLDEMRSSMTAASAAVDTAEKSPDQLYQAACLACHSTGAAGAPKIGDAAAWTARLAKGLDSLVTSAINGIGAMPPRGGSQYNDDQVRATIEYILSESK